MTTMISCPGCNERFERGAGSGCLQCPRCQLAFVPEASGEENESYDLQLSESSEPVTRSADLTPLVEAPGVGESDDDDEFRLAPDEASFESEIRKQTAQRHLQETQAAASFAEAENLGSLMDQVAGRAESSSRHFRTVIIGFAIMFGGLLALARIAGHYSQGRTSEVLPMLFMAVAGLGICIIIYGVGRGVVEMVMGLLKRSP